MSGPAHSADSSHTHTHGVIDPVIARSKRGIWAIKWSLIGLLLTTFIQLAIVFASGSMGLLADAIHNGADAFTAIPLWIAFRLAPRPPTERFPYGYGRVEDIGGLMVVFVIFLSAVSTAYFAVKRLVHPLPVQHLGAVAAAAVVGFLGNEGVALLRIKVGREIGSAALVADGYHARADGWTSLSVLVGVLGAWRGYPIADPLVGLGITALIAGILWSSGKTVFARLLDGVDPGIIRELKHAIRHADGVRDVTEVRARWLGHQLRAEINIAVDDRMPIEEAHRIGETVRHELLHHLEYLSHVTIHVDPLTLSGEHHHRVDCGAHDAPR